MATQMMCGDTIIDDEQQPVPVTAAQVLAACGEPTSKADGQWVYEQQGQLTKVLEFDGDGNLQSISDQPGGG
jgi:outer membrane biogenesis lipoprotein LolB